MAKNNDKQQRTASLGFEDKLWASADLLRNNMDPAKYKHVVLGLLFLKYIEDAFEERQQVIRAAFSDTYDDDELAAMLEDRDEYTAENVFGPQVPATCFDEIATLSIVRNKRSSRQGDV